MAEPPALLPPRLSEIQLAWLQEAGIDRRLLQYWQAADARAANSPPAMPKPIVPAVQPNTGASRRPDPLPRRGPVAQVLPPAGLVRVSAVGISQLPNHWEELREQVLACTVCSLHAARNSAVFGSGSIDSVDWMVIGEAPGDRDDRLGLPFQGKAGDLLQAMLQAAGVGKDVNVFYTNVLKCRPRAGRMPAADEIASCLPYLSRQIALLKPRRILALGRLAAEALLGSQAGLESLRGVVHAYTDEAGSVVPVVATYHPASLLSRPRHKAAAWADLLKIRSLS